MPPRSPRRWLAPVLAVLLVGVAVPAAGAQDPVTDPAPEAPAPDAPPPADPPPAEVPGGGDGSEIPVETPDPSGGGAPLATGPAPAAGAPAPSAAAPAVPDARATARWRADVARRITAGQSALAVARQAEAELTQQLIDADARLAEGQARLDRAGHRTTSSEAAAGEAAATARQAVSTARERRQELRAVAVGMYLDPPQEAGLAAALRGRLRQHLAAQGLLAARAEVARRSATAAQRSAVAARKRTAGAQRAAAEARSATQDEQRAVAELSAEVSRRQMAVDEARARVAALVAELGGLAEVDTGLGGRLLVEATVASGGVLVTRHPDGSWTAQPVGLPGPGDMVRVPGTSIQVHKLIGDRAAAMVRDAAAAGVALNGWGYRSALRQIQLRQAHCGPSYAAVFEQDSATCSPPTARPGRSMHERGLAIDFSACSSRTAACYLWLADNAWRYGFFNLPSEPWHWSTNGR